LRLPDPDKVPLSMVDWAHAGRLVPARYRAAECFERIADHVGMRDLQAQLADFTGAGAEDFGTMDPAKLLFGPGAGWISACFVAPRPGRFSTAREGAFYVARDLGTSIAEVKYHLEADYRREGLLEPMDLEFRALRVTLKGAYHDIRTRSRTRAPWAAICAPDSHVGSQAFAARLREAGSPGILWLSLRRTGGECAAIFDPNTLRACRHETYLTFRWNGQEVDQVYERRILKFGSEV